MECVKKRKLWMLPKQALTLYILNRWTSGCQGVFSIESSIRYSVAKKRKVNGMGDTKYPILARPEGAGQFLLLRTFTLRASDLYFD